jgi:hypothetical protein
MAAVSTRGYHQKQHLPPSPPLSPPTRRRRHKKKLDPFEELATTPIPSAPSSPTTEPEDKPDSLLTRVSLTHSRRDTAMTDTWKDSLHPHNLHIIPHIALPRELPQPNSPDPSAFLRLLDPRISYTLTMA